MYMTKRKNDKALDQLIKDARIDDLKAALPDKDNSLYMGYLRDLLYHPASADYSDFLITKFENEAEKDVSLSKMLAKIGPIDRNIDFHESGTCGTFYRRYLRNGI